MRVLKYSIYFLLFLTASIFFDLSLYFEDTNKVLSVLYLLCVLQIMTLIYVAFELDNLNDKLERCLKC